MTYLIIWGLILLTLAVVAIRNYRKPDDKPFVYKDRYMQTKK